MLLILDSCIFCLCSSLVLNLILPIVGTCILFFRSFNRMLLLFACIRNDILGFFCDLNLGNPIFFSFLCLLYAFIRSMKTCCLLLDSLFLRNGYSIFSSLRILFKFFCVGFMFSYLIFPSILFQIKPRLPIF